MGRLPIILYLLSLVSGIKEKYRNFGFENPDVCSSGKTKQLELGSGAAIFTLDTLNTPISEGFTKCGIKIKADEKFGLLVHVEDMYLRRKLAGDTDSGCIDYVQFGRDDVIPFITLFKSDKMCGNFTGFSYDDPEGDLLIWLSLGPSRASTYMESVYTDRLSVVVTAYHRDSARGMGSSFSPCMEGTPSPDAKYRWIRKEYFCDRRPNCPAGGSSPLPADERPTVCRHLQGGPEGGWGEGGAAGGGGGSAGWQPPLNLVTITLVMVSAVVVVVLLVMLAVRMRRAGRLCLSPASAAATANGRRRRHYHQHQLQTHRGSSASSDCELPERPVGITRASAGHRAGVGLIQQQQQSLVSVASAGSSSRGGEGGGGSSSRDRRAVAGRQLSNNLDTTVGPTNVWSPLVMMNMGQHGGGGGGAVVAATTSAADWHAAPVGGGGSGETAMLGRGTTPDTEPPPAYHDLFPLDFKYSPEPLPPGGHKGADMELTSVAAAREPTAVAAAREPTAVVAAREPTAAQRSRPVVDSDRRQKESCAALPEETDQLMVSSSPLPAEVAGVGGGEGGREAGEPGGVDRRQEAGGGQESGASGVASLSEPCAPADNILN